MSAKYYIYRNLRTNGFSVRYRGRVIEQVDDAVAEDVTFVVNPYGYLKAQVTRQRNVHAFVVCSKYKTSKKKIAVDELEKVSYNPFIADQFTCNNKAITQAKRVVLTGGKCYLGD